ncbi:MAG: hypothetical protein HYZ25_21130 [Chloroflexi bacterium]|nr:hypothetical protein [Chloroflexota bacterium]
MKIKLLSLFTLFLFLSGCSSNSSLERAVNFEKGISKIPEGYSIFLEYVGRSVCSDQCNCAPEAPAPLYEFTSSDELWIERDLGVTSTGEPWIEKDLEGLPTLSSPIVGFFVFNDWGGRIYVVDTLPFTLDPGDTPIATLYSVDTDGTAVVEVYGETYFIKPGQSWTDSGDTRREPPFGCHISYTTSLTNFGLFSQKQIRFGYPDRHQ